ncbi:MAG: PHB depolymerase family esterase [Candidatus Wallbacteria bacterium]|nr:PHB depolymerase family esterase [Candidatus Wallbacteria bacterium]
MSVCYVFMSGVILINAAGPIKPGEYEREMMQDKVKRTYILHIPPQYDGKKALPLVLVLHGGAGNAKQTAKWLGFSEKADKNGFIVVYPNGSGLLKEKLLTWNSGNCCGYALRKKIDDVGFIRLLIEVLENTLKIDPCRIFATGISNGGMMSYRLACELSDKLAAVAPVAGALNCETKMMKYPVSLIVFHGTADQHVLYKGGEPKKTILLGTQRVDKSVAESVGFFVKFDGCSTVSQKVEMGKNINVDIYSGGKNETEVILYTIKGMGHAWPGGTAYAPGADQPNLDISATNQIWEFFKSHPRKK